MMQELKIRPIESKEAERVESTLFLALFANRYFRWLMPHLEDYYRNAHDIVRQVLKRSARAGCAFVSEDGAAASLVLPSKDVVAPSLLPELRAAMSPELLVRVQKLDDALSKKRPSGPYWHLMIIGVDPLLVRSSHETQMLLRTIERAKEEGLPLYLETSNPRFAKQVQDAGGKPLSKVRIGNSPVMRSLVITP